MKRVTDISAMSEQALMCRDLRHAWAHVNDTVHLRREGKARVITRALQCSRCTTTREDVYLVPTFDKVSSKSTYPDDYLLTAGRAYVSEIRSELFTRNGMLKTTRRKRATARPA